jgi:hypothetical protein
MQEIRRLSLALRFRILQLPTTFYNYENRALTSSPFRPKVKTANRDELAANASRPVFIVGVGKTSFH